MGNHFALWYIKLKTYRCFCLFLVTQALNTRSLASDKVLVLDGYER